MYKLTKQTNKQRKQKQKQKQTNKQKTKIKIKQKHPSYYVDHWLLFRHCSDIPTHEEKCCCEKTEV